MVLKINFRRKAIIILSVLLIFCYEYRTIYVFEESGKRRFYTIWKDPTKDCRNCFIIPGLYLGLFPPKNNYIRCDRLLIRFYMKNDSLNIFTDAEIYTPHVHKSINHLTDSSKVFLYEYSLHDAKGQQDIFEKEKMLESEIDIKNKKEYHVVPKIFRLWDF